jgi:hypothetical protein
MNSLNSGTAKIKLTTALGLRRRRKPPRAPDLSGAHRVRNGKNIRRGRERSERR